MDREHPCCRALEMIEEQADDAIKNYNILPLSQQQLLHTLKLKLDAIKEMCSSARGFGPP